MSPRRRRCSLAARCDGAPTTRRERPRREAAARTRKGFATGHSICKDAHPRLLLIHGDSTLAGEVRDQAERSGLPLRSCAHFTHLEDGLTYLGVSPVDLVMLGETMADADLKTGLRRLAAQCPLLPLVVLVAGSTAATEQEYRDLGAMALLDPGAMSPAAWRRTIGFCLREQDLANQLAEVTARLDWLTHMDAVTGVLNRRGLERAIMKELVRCRELDTPLAVMLIDIDDFRRFNTTLGHGVGDMVLAGAAKRINTALGDGAVVGRCGTDQFLAILPGADMERMTSRAQQVRLAISRDAIIAGQEVFETTASLGVTAISPATMSFDEVVARARFALSHSKTGGKNRVTAAVDNAAATVGKATATVAVVGQEADMVPTLLQGKALAVASQPIVDLMDGRIVSREMLVRGPEGPLHAPDNLFRYCQEQDILTAVDLRCLKLCAGTAARLGPQARFHVNILPTTLLQTPVEELIRVLDIAAHAGDCCLEISEQQLLGDPEVLAEPVRRLRQAGIGIAIDDVGFGNSCLEGLLMLKPEVLKIDKRLVRGLAQDAGMRGVLQRLLQISSVLGAEVVAEGVENHEDYQVLLEMGVRLGQGYLFGRPELCSHDPRFAGGGSVNRQRGLSAEA